MENFCLYNGKKIVKPEIWNITSIELSIDYTSAIIQAESKSNKSEYTLDITPLINNQYKNGIDPYSATIVNELTGVSNWVLDPANNQIKYTDPNTANPDAFPKVWVVNTIIETAGVSPQAACSNAYTHYLKPTPDMPYQAANTNGVSWYCPSPEFGSNSRGAAIKQVANPNYDPDAEQEQKTLPLDVVVQQVISNAVGGDTAAQNSIVSTFNNITDDILTSDYSEFFEQNKQPK